jgi:hypothetical protein
MQNKVNIPKAKKIRKPKKKSPPTKYHKTGTFISHNYRTGYPCSTINLTTTKDSFKQYKNNKNHK